METSPVRLSASAPNGVHDQTISRRKCSVATPQKRRAGAAESSWLHTSKPSRISTKEDNSKNRKVRSSLTQDPLDLDEGR